MYSGARALHHETYQGWCLTTIGRFQQPPPQLTVTFAHDAPALVGARFPVTITVHANGDEVESGEVVVECSAAEGKSPFTPPQMIHGVFGHSSVLCHARTSVVGPVPTLTDSEGQPVSSLPLPPLTQAAEHTIELVVHASEVAKCAIHAHVRPFPFFVAPQRSAGGA